MMILTLASVRRWQQYSKESEEEQEYYVSAQVKPIYQPAI